MIKGRLLDDNFIINDSARPLNWVTIAFTVQCPDQLTVVHGVKITDTDSTETSYGNTR